MTWDFEDTDKEKQRKDEAEASPEKASGTTGDPMQAALDQALPIQVNKGDIVTGVVAAVDDQVVSVDIGSKYEGIIPVSEFASPDEFPAVDDEIEVAVVKVDDEESVIRLSKRRADYERVWNRLTEAVETGEIVEAIVTDRVKGGLRVDVGMPGFVPGKHVATRNLRNLERFVGQSLRLRVLEADRESKKLILSHRVAIEEERERRRQETLSNLEEGVVCEGKVRSLTSYGAFIDLGGVDGLLHISEMAWTHVKHPSEVLKVGDTVRVAVLDIDRENNRISLSRRQILPDPWKEAAPSIRVGSVLKARITRVVRTGAFAQLFDYEIEGFIPISEMSNKRISEASDVVSAGQEVDLKVIDMRIKARRMSLSLVAADQEKERQEYQQYMANQEQPKLTLGDQFGDVLQQVAVEDETEEVQEKPAEEEATEEEDVEAAEEVEPEGEPQQVAETEGEPQQVAETEEEATEEEDVEAAEEVEPEGEPQQVAETAEEEPTEEEDVEAAAEAAAEETEEEPEEKAAEEETEEEAETAEKPKKPKKAASTKKPKKAATTTKAKKPKKPRKAKKDKEDEDAADKQDKPEKADE